ncbi:Predicted PurR-regulated permease PerM [Palleronia marisminoris]|uniref:AI-2 transport protein TqsA n=1 Tax=Palleronia marisminoris TaxID=315423 RepID=A0A1Y5RX53_9RHOB|nr:AI-2E family transporter [Palleronia marisminoris]SFG45086.1 Predicted PurR-regulated permease PerM [Palleronia marisminoris]SLN26193.1 AI-2 transport protein TqsA [Palleronia marisminoris]
MPQLSNDWPWTAAKLLLVAAAVVTAMLLAWQLANVLLLLFGAILVAVLLKAVAGPVERFTPLSERWSVAIACLIVGGVLVGFFTLMGTQIQTQAKTLVEGLPDLLEALEQRFGISGLRAWLEEQLADVLRDGEIAVSVATYATTFASILAHVLIVIASGIYLATRPRAYAQGLKRLFPEQRQSEARDTIGTIGDALKLWLLGQLVAMVLVGVLTTLGLWLLGIQSAMALGFLAGLLEFVPFVGPALAAVPAIALGLSESPTTGLWVLGLYILVQQVEGNLITPLVQQRAVDLPPVVTIFAILSFGVLFGTLGVLLATPLAVVCLVLVKKHWMRDVLHERVDVPGEDDNASGEAAH